MTSFILLYLLALIQRIYLTAGLAVSVVDLYTRIQYIKSRSVLYRSHKTMDMSLNVLGYLSSCFFFFFDKTILCTPSYV